MTFFFVLFAGITMACAVAFVWAISTDERAQRAAEMILQFRRDIRR